MDGIRKRVASGTIGVVVCLFSPAAAAAPGDLDPTFGTGGIAVTAAIPTLHQGAQAAVGRQSDGRIIVAAEEGGTHDFVVRRFDSNGVLDATFATGGSVVIDLGGDDEPFAIAIQTDDRIVVAGTSTLASNPRTGLVRLESDGTLDATFGSGGKVVTSIGTSTSAHDVALQSDGRILVVGETGGSFALDLYVARYDASGTLDATFGAGGIVIKSVGFWSDAGFSLAVQPDGAILAGGFSFLGGDYGQWLLVRLLTNGAVDASFGSGGVVETDVTGTGLDAEILDIVVQPDGRILAGGSTGTTILGWPSDFAVARYLVDGSLDPSWGTAGIVITPTLIGGTSRTTPVHALALQPDGAVVAVGGGSTDVSFPLTQLIAARYHADGTLDATWGTGGLVVVPAPFDTQLGSDALLQPDGRLVVAVRDATRLSALRLTAGAVCGNGVLDDGEVCDASSGAEDDCCSPACTPEPEGTSCDDGDPCTTADFCSDGACAGDAAPAPDCRLGAQSLLSLKDGPDDADRFRWVWKRGAETTSAEVAPQRYTVCVYDARGASQPIARLATAGPTCGLRSCFTTTPRRTVYSDSETGSDGLRRLVLQPGGAGRSRTMLLAKGVHLALPALPLVPPVAIQLHAESGLCWGASFSAPKRNDSKRFQAVD